MSLIVVTVLTAKPGRGLAVIESFREISPLVHAEPECESSVAAIAFTLLVSAGTQG